MDLFDIVGPIMVGPSSSHTAGAVRMGYVAGKLLGEPIQKAEILLYGSFLATGEGHGTRKAIVAGILTFFLANMEVTATIHPGWSILCTINVGHSPEKPVLIPSILSMLIREPPIEEI